METMLPGGQWTISTLLTFHLERLFIGGQGNSMWKVIAYNDFGGIPYVRWNGNRRSWTYNNQTGAIYQAEDLAKYHPGVRHVHIVDPNGKIIFWHTKRKRRDLSAQERWYAAYRREWRNEP